MGDWVNEYCDLTLDKMAEILGARPEREIPKELTAEYVTASTRDGQR